MSTEDWKRMELTEEPIHPKAGYMTNARFQGKDKGSIISQYIKEHDVSNTQVDIEKTRVNLLATRKKNSPRIRMELYCIFKKTENCPSYYIATVSRQEDVINGPVKWHIEKHGICDHTAGFTVSRPLSGGLRHEEKEKLRYKNPTKHYHDTILLHGEDAEATGDSSLIKNPHVFRQCKTEIRAKERLAPYWYADISLRRDHLVSEDQKKFGEKSNTGSIP